MARRTFPKFDMAKSIPYGWLLAGILTIPGCTLAPPAKPTPVPKSARLPVQVTPVTTPVARPSGIIGQDATGRYYAARISGDFVGYPELESFIGRMTSRHGFSREYLYGLFSQVHRKEATIRLLGPAQISPTPPRPGAWTRYRAKFLTEPHIAAGAAFWSRHAATLQRAAERYGVPPEYVMGIMGVETIYGGNVGNFRVIDALTTAAFDYPRRAEYFTGELENLLLMAREESLDPSRPVGSFAGAMGLGQFMPGSFLHHAVDFDGDGRRDLWDPVDAIGSVANYFAAYGWKRGEPVVTPAVANGEIAQELQPGLENKYSLPTLAGYGIRPTSMSGFSPNSTVRLLRLSTLHGDEYWLGHDNFYVISRYNHSTHYAMAVHELAQAVKRRHQGGVVSGR